MKRSEFKTYHPIVNFVYFVFVIGFSMFLMHPLCLAISFFGAFGCCGAICGAKRLKTSLAYIIPLIILTAVFNPLFNHEGVSILTYLPSGNPLTGESVVYGVAAAVMIASVICYFSCVNEIMTSDKIIYLFGRLAPSLSLILSMTLRFVPRFSLQMKRMALAHRAMRHTGGGIVKRAKHGISLVGAMITHSFEASADTADSMRARGYGLGKRTAYSVYRFDKRDVMALVCIVALGSYTLVGVLGGEMEFDYFPKLTCIRADVYSMSVFAAYMLLCLLPIIIEIWEARKWKSSKQKI